MSLNSGTLWIVATPLGNPGDLSPRAREILATVDGVLAEDTRRTGLLFARCGIVSRASFTSLHEHSEQGRLAQVTGWLQEGKNLALVSDAGTPLLSDPGYLLVRACRSQGIPVRPVPGPSAVVTALSASGLPPQPFAFLGFPPRKSADRERFFAPYATIPITLVFFERKDRLHETLASALTVLGERDGCIARELTKTYEEFHPFSLGQYAALPADFLGEITVVLGPPQAGSRSDRDAVAAALLRAGQGGGRPKDIARQVHEMITGWSVKEIYSLMQAMPLSEGLCARQATTAEDDASPDDRVSLEEGQD